MTVIEPRYQRHVAAVTPMSPKPEMRLELSVIAAWCMTIAMFWFGWTSYNSIHWISPMFAAVLLGFGVLGALDSATNFVDVFRHVCLLLQLHRRRVSVGCSLSSGGHDRRQIDVWCWIPSVRWANV
jgi:hypothetical protein